MWERRLIAAIVRHRIAVLGLIAALSVAAGASALRLGFSSDIEMWLLDDDEALVTYRAFLERFSADEVSVLGVFAPSDAELGIFEPGSLKALELATEAARGVPHAWRVLSLTTLDVVESRGPASVRVAPLVEEVPADRAAARALRERALGNPLVAGHVISEDGRAAAIVVELDPEGNTFEGKTAQVEALRAVGEALPPGLEWRLAGSPALDDAFFRYTERDFMVLGPISAAVVLIACFLLFRRVTAALIPMAVVGLACLWVFGLMGAIGLDLNMVSSGLLVLVLAVGVADSIHVLSDYAQQLMAGAERDEAVVHATASLVVPCFFTSATTAAGFLSLLVSDLAPIREFGWLSAVGVFFAFLLSMSFIPCLLRLVPPPDADFVERQRTGPVSRVLAWMGDPTGRARVTVASGVALLALSGWGLTHLEVGANPLNYFKPGDPIREAMVRIDRELGGSTSFEFLVTTPDGGLKEPDTLRRLGALERFLEDIPGVTRVVSVLDALRETRGAFTDGASRALPDSRPMAAQFYLTLEGGDDFSAFVQGDYSVARMTARVRMSESEKVTARAADIGRKLRAEYADETLTVEPTGFIKLMSEMEHYLFQSQVRSLMLAFTVVTLMMLLLLRSWRLALFSMIPNFVPIFLGLAFMALAGIALDPGTVMIGSMALGLVVDDTVHFLVRLRRNLHGRDLEGAIAGAMAQTGRAIILTSFVLAGGFLVLSFGSFMPNIAFGQVSAVVVLLALLADLVLLPAALLVIRPRLSGGESALPESR